MWRRIVVWALIGVTLLGASCGPCRIPPAPAALASDDSGGAIVLYQVWEVSDSYGQFHAQKISPEGGFLWGEEGILVGSGYKNELGMRGPYAISDGSGGAIMIWMERLPQPEGEVEWSYFQSHAAGIDSEGNVKWRRDIPGIDQAIPDGSGGVIIAFDDIHDNLFVLKIDAEGNLPWGKEGVSLNLSGYDSQRDIASDGLGGVIAVQRIPKEGIVRAQRVDSQGNILWQTGGVQACVCLAEEARAVSDGAGGAIVAYMGDIPCDDGRIGGYCDSDIYAQRIDADGNVLWGSEGVPICAGSSSFPNTPKIVTDGAGGAIISYDFIGDHAAFRAGRIDADGHLLWEQEGELWGGTVVSDGVGGVISVWYGEEGTNARAQRLDGTGSELWGPDGLVLPDLRWSLVTPDGCGGVLLSWSAAEFKGCELSELSCYVQRIDAEGNLPWGDEGILLNP